MNFLLLKDVAIHREEILPGVRSEVIFMDMAHFDRENLDYPQDIHVIDCHQMGYIWQLKKYEAMKYYQCLTLGTFSKSDTCKKYQSLVSLMRLSPDEIYQAAGKIWGNEILSVFDIRNIFQAWCI